MMVSAQSPDLSRWLQSFLTYHVLLLPCILAPHQREPKPASPQAHHSWRPQLRTRLLVTGPELSTNGPHQSQYSSFLPGYSGNQYRKFDFTCDLWLRVSSWLKVEDLVMHIVSVPESLLTNYGNSSGVNFRGESINYVCKVLGDLQIESVRLAQRMV